MIEDFLYKDWIDTGCNFYTQKSFYKRLFMFKFILTITETTKNFLKIATNLKQYDINVTHKEINRKTDINDSNSSL